LSHTFAAGADKAGLSIGQIKASMGQTCPETTLRYLKRREVIDESQANRIASELGLDMDSEDCGV